MQPQTVIVYQSRSEYEMDQFWQQNPEAILIIFGIMAVAAIIMLLKNYIEKRRMRNFFKNRSNF
jgi:hypothetical protein